MTDQEAQKDVQAAFGQMFQKMIGKDGKVVSPDINAPYLAEIAGDAKTYDEFIKRVAPKWGGMSVEQKDGTLRFVYRLLSSSIGYDYEGAKKDPNKAADLKNGIVGNANQGNQRTATCYSFTLFSAQVLKDLGAEKSIHQIEITKNFLGHLMRPDGGHTALVVEVAKGSIFRLLDLTQGNVGEGNVDLGNIDVHHQKYSTMVKGREVELDVSPENFRQFPGDSWEDMKIRIRALAEEHRLFALQQEIDKLINTGKTPEAIEMLKKAIEDGRSLLRSSPAFEDKYLTINGNLIRVLGAMRERLGGLTGRTLTFAEQSMYDEINRKKVLPLFDDHKRAMKLSKVNINDPEVSIILDRILLTVDQLRRENSYLPDFVEHNIVQVEGMVRKLKNSLSPAMRSKGANNIMSPDRASKTVDKTNGGIDFNTNKLNLQIQNAGERIKFNLDPAMLQQLRNASGFVPTINSIQPMTDLNSFLGII